MRSSDYRRPQSLTASQPELSADIQSDPETRGIRVLFLVVVLMGAISILVPAVSRKSQVEVGFVPELLIGLLALALVFNWHLASQRKSVLRLSNALISAISYIEKLEQFSFLDPQTQLFNRRYLDQLFSQQSKLLNRSGVPTTLLLIELRVEGEDLSEEDRTNEAAFVLRSNFRGSDYIVRLTSEQFLVVLPDTTERQAQYPISRLSEKADYCNLEKEEVEMILRYQFSTCPPGCDLWEQLRVIQQKMLSQADLCLEQAPAPETAVRPN